MKKASPDMTQIVACIDHSEVAGAVSDAGAWISQRVERPLVLLHVLDRSAYPIPSDLSGNIGLGARTQLLEELASLDAERNRMALEQGLLQLNEARQRAQALGVRDVRLLQRHGHFVDTLASMQEETRILVMGRKGEDNADSLRSIGSNLETVIRTLSCRILVTPGTFKPPESVLLAYDASPTAKQVLYILARSPLCRGLPFHLVMVADDEAKNRALLAEAEQELRAHGHEQVIATLLQGPIEETLLNHIEQEQIGLLIMGAYGHSRIRQFLVGSTTSRLLRQSPVPILLLRQ